MKLNIFLALYTTLNNGSKSKLTTEKLQSLCEWNSDTKKLFGPPMKSKNKLNKGTFKQNSSSMTTTDMNNTCAYEYIDSPQIIENLKNNQHTSITRNLNFKSANNENVTLEFVSFDKYKDLCNYSLYYNENDTNKLSNIPKLTFIPSVSKILKETMPEESKLHLLKWEEEMILKHGLEGFENIKKDTFNKGTNLHLNIQSFLINGCLQNLLPDNEGYWDSVMPVLNRIQNVINTELDIQHKDLLYKGILDCIANYENEICLIDWKTSKQRKTTLSHTFDNPLQMVAYLGAFNSSSRDKQIHKCLLVITYEDGSPADVLKMNSKLCSKYWQLWLQRLKKYWMLFDKNE